MTTTAEDVAAAVREHLTAAATRRLKLAAPNLSASIRDHAARTSVDHTMPIIEVVLRTASPATLTEVMKAIRR